MGAFRSRFFRRSDKSEPPEPSLGESDEHDPSVGEADEGEPAVEPAGKPSGDAKGGDAGLGQRPGGEGDPDEDEDGEWLAYELHPWALENRVMLQQLLVGDQVVHSWQGTTLLVHFSLEDEVDGLISEVEEATDRRIRPDDELTAYELGEWPQELREDLVARLRQAGVPCQLDETEGGCDLLVREADDERADLVIDDLLARVEEAELTELDGLEVNDLLSSLFVACDRLRRDPHDPEGVLGAVASARQVSQVRTPFGFSAESWRGLRNAAGTLLGLLESDDTDDEKLRELAHRLRDALQTLI